MFRLLYFALTVNFSFNRIESQKQSHGIGAVIDKALASGGPERLTPQNRALSTTGESKTPFSQGIVPRKAPTMPKPQWHPPWKLSKVRIDLCIFFRSLFTVLFVCFLRYLTQFGRGKSIADNVREQQFHHQGQF